MKRCALIGTEVVALVFCVLLWATSGGGKPQLSLLPGSFVPTSDSGIIRKIDSSENCSSNGSHKSQIFLLLNQPASNPVTSRNRVRHHARHQHRTFNHTASPQLIEKLPTTYLRTVKPSLSPQQDPKAESLEDLELSINQFATTAPPIPFMGDYNCSDEHCTQFLSVEDWKYFNCLRNFRKRDPNEKRFVGKCHFMDGRNRQTVLLLSYPGSGNTWVRGLLEQATGICTGAIWCDGTLRRDGFNGENLRSGVVLVTKTTTVPGHIVGLRVQGNKPEEITRFMDEVGLRYQLVEMDLTRETVKEVLMSLREFVSQRSGLWYTVIDDTEFTDDLVDALLTGLKFTQ